MLRVPFDGTRMGLNASEEGIDSKDDRRRQAETRSPIILENRCLLVVFHAIGLASEQGRTAHPSSGPLLGCW